MRSEKRDINKKGFTSITVICDGCEYLGSDGGVMCCNHPLASEKNGTDFIVAWDANYEHRIVGEKKKCPLKGEHKSTDVICLCGYKVRMNVIGNNTADAKKQCSHCGRHITVHFRRFPPNKRKGEGK